MIDFTRSQLKHLIIHTVGNKSLGESLELASKTYEFKDDYTRDTVISYLTAGFKGEKYYRFTKRNDFEHRDVQSLSENVFRSAGASTARLISFMESSNDLARLLYDNTLHPKIKGGEFYVAFFKDVVVDGELVNALGLFKTENKETFLQINNGDIECETGIDVKKLDRGALIFDTEHEKGYKISIVENRRKAGAETFAYWHFDFLKATIKENSYYHTNNFIETCRGFAEEVLTQDNNVSTDNKNLVLNKSLNFVANRDKVDLKEFETEVLAEPELITAFKDYQKDFNDRLDIKPAPEFEVSPTAVKENKKYLRTVIKLDKNFHVYIHARHELIERGFDEEKGMKFIKLYYVNEE